MGAAQRRRVPLFRYIGKTAALRILHSCLLALVTLYTQIYPHKVLTLLPCTGRDASSVTWYNTVNSPAKRIKSELTTAFPSWTVSLPSDTTSTCDLTATNNVFGRLLNGVTESSVCTLAANASTITGQFVHIEQADSALVPDNYLAFAAAMNRAIATTCAAGMQMDSTSSLCV
jgi:hypothetical protein